jgi:AraC family transcriptional regulator
VDRRISATIQIMHLQGHHKVLVRDLARRVNLSPWHFSRLFKVETSISPKQYIRRFKITRAEYLLRQSFLTVKEIAAEVGFGDRSHFSRDFKMFWGQSPSEVRRGKKI